MTATLYIRRARVSDANRLTRLGMPATDGKKIFVAERGGAFAGAVSFAAQAFESEVLGFDTVRLDRIHDKVNDLPGILRGCLRLLKRDGCRLVSCRRPETDREVLAALQASGFSVIECLVTLARKLPKSAAAAAKVRLARAADDVACGRIAAQAFHLDRFHADPKLSKVAASRLKAAWARNAVRGRADAVFVATAGSSLAGFNACLRRQNDAIIDLIGVAPRHQNRGVGRALVQAAIAHYAGSATQLTVGTQSCNYASLGLYQSLGFRIKSSALTLHAHLS